MNYRKKKRNLDIWKDYELNIETSILKNLIKDFQYYIF